MNRDGSMREYRGAVPPATWITCHTLGTLSDISRKSQDLKNNFQIPRDSLEKMAVWLIQQQQDRHGRFTEVGVEHVTRLRVSSHLKN